MLGVDTTGTLGTRLDAATLPAWQLGPVPSTSSRSGARRRARTISATVPIDLDFVKRTRWERTAADLLNLIPTEFAALVSAMKGPIQAASGSSVRPSFWDVINEPSVLVSRYRCTAFRHVETSDAC